MQIKMGEQEMNIRMLAEKSGVSRQTISLYQGRKELFSGGSVQLGKLLEWAWKKFWISREGILWRESGTM